MGTKAGVAEAILHPQRMSILRALGAGPLTTRQLAEALPDIPQATLYRHIALLHEVQVLTIASERPVRGTIERTYALGSDTILSAHDLAGASKEDHFRFFATFVAGLMAEYGQYLERPSVDLERDLVGYQEHVLNLTDDELAQMIGELGAVIRSRLKQPPAAGRRPRLFATITMPADRIRRKKP